MAYPIKMTKPCTAQYPKDLQKPAFPLFEWEYEPCQMQAKDAKAQSPRTGAKISPKTCKGISSDLIINAQSAWRPPNDHHQRCEPAAKGRPDCG